MIQRVHPVVFHLSDEDFVTANDGSSQSGLPAQQADSCVWSEHYWILTNILILIDFWLTTCRISTLIICMAAFVEMDINITGTSESHQTYGC